MNTLCFVLVLFATQIINTKEVSSLDQSKTASTSTTGRPAPQDVYNRIDFSKVELFKDDDKLPSNPEGIKRVSNQFKLINLTKTNLPKTGPPTTIQGNLTSSRIYDDYDINDLHLDKYKIILGPNKYKTINATNIRFLNQNLDGSRNLVWGKHLVPPNGTGPESVPGVSVNSSNISVPPIPWVISPACQQQDESKYIFSAIFTKKPTVHFLGADNGTTPNNQTPKILINHNSVTMSVGNATLPSSSYVKINSSAATKNHIFTKTPNSVVAVITNMNTPAIKNPNAGKLQMSDAILTGLTTTILNTTKPQSRVTVSIVGDPMTNSGGIKINRTDIKPIPPVLTQPNAAAQQIQQTIQLIPQLQTNVPVKIPMITIPAQGTKKIEPIPVFLVKNGLPQTPIPRIAFNKTTTQAYKRSQQAINNILNLELGQRSFFPSELDQDLQRPTGDLITQKGTEVQSSDILYELFKNMTITNVINEDLNRKLLDESQIHTQQNWQLIKGNSEILNVLKNESNLSSQPLK